MECRHKLAHPYWVLSVNKRLYSLWDYVKWFILWRKGDTQSKTSDVRIQVCPKFNQNRSMICTSSLSDQWRLWTLKQMSRYMSREWICCKCKIHVYWIRAGVIGETAAQKIVICCRWRRLFGAWAALHISRGWWIFETCGRSAVSW